MKRDEHKKLVNELLGLANPDHQARASEILTSLSEDYETVLTESETASNNVTKLTKDNETLRDVNAKLFLKVGATDKETPHPKTDEAGEDEGNKSDKITFDKLFNEKGELI